MAKLVECGAWTDRNSLAMRLQSDLSDEYVVVNAPTVRGRDLDVIVIGPQGLFVLHENPVADEESVTDEMGDAETQTGADAGEPEDALQAQVRQTTMALEEFLEDEFPSLNPGIHHFRILDDSDREQEPSESPHSAVPETVAERISSTEAKESGRLPEWQVRAELGVALRDRRLTASQRASRPFVFRSGHALSQGTEVWTVQEAVRHMDENPESGIYHLQNGTLEAWLHEEGAEHLARLANEVMQEDGDYRAALETFLIGTGLVSRPQLEIRPDEVDLGYALAGESVARRIRVGKGRGRGYLFGRLEPAVPWLSVHPREFDGEERWSVVTVRADTQSLPITREPPEGAVYVHSNASEEPVTVPVRVQIVGLPSFLNRGLLRPAAALATAGLLGAGFGWLLTVRGVPAADLLGRLSWLPFGPSTAWVTLTALIWAAVGAVRGATQPMAWPIGYTWRRWLARIVAWALSLGLAGGAARWAWVGLRDVGAPPIPRLTAWLVIVGPIALTIVPATIGEIQSGQDMRDTSTRAIRWSFLRPLSVPVGAFALGCALRFGAPALRPLWEQVNAGEVAATARNGISEWLTELEGAVQQVIDYLYIQFYEGSPISGPLFSLREVRQRIPADHRAPPTGSDWAGSGP